MNLVDSGFLRIIKRIAIETINATKPAELQFGTLTKKEPIEIKIDQKLILDKDLIVNDLKKSKLCKDLKVGDKVVLLRNQGGQEYAIIDIASSEVVSG